MVVPDELEVNMQQWVPSAILTVLVFVILYRLFLILCRSFGSSRVTSQGSWGGPHVPISDGASGATSSDSGSFGGGDSGACGSGGSS
jgi:hypothetical protein